MSAFLAHLSRSRKAYLAAVVSGLTVLYSVLADSAITPQEWIAVALGTLGVGGGTYAVPNGE